jgi:transposase
MGMHKSKELKESDLEILTSLMQRVDKASDFKRLQCVYLRSKGLDANQVAALVQYSVEHVKSVWTAYFKGGVEALCVKPKGGRYNFHLSLEEEKELLARHTRAGEKGHMLEIGPLYQSLCKKVGHPVALTTAYRIAHRHGWRKIAPRPEHPSRNPKAAEYFKAFFP